MKREQIMMIYRAAIDGSALSSEGEHWWDEIHAEIEAIIAAPTRFAAAMIIAWWMSDYEWARSDDTPANAARRIRHEAKIVTTQPKADVTASMVPRRRQI